MNHPGHSSLRTLWLIGLMCTLLHPALSRAENWQTLELRLSPGRAAHGFSLVAPSGTENSPSATFDGLFELPSPDGSFIRLQVWVDTDQPFTLLDTTVFDYLEVPAPGSTAIVNPGDNWLLTDEMGTFPSNHHYFLISSDRVGDTFLVALAGGQVYMLPILGSPAPVSGSNPVQYRFELGVTGWSGGDFWVIDLTTNQRSQSGLIDLADLPWIANTAPPPVGQAFIFLDPNQVGQTFTLHSRAAGGTEHLQSVTANGLDCNVGSWVIGSMDENFLYTTGHAGEELTIPEGAGFIIATVGYAMEFWLTRDSDGATCPVQSMPVAPVAQWWFPGVFSPPPPPPPIRVEAQFRDSESGYSVIYYDPVNQSYPSVAFIGIGSGTLYSYDDYGQIIDSLYYVDAYAEIPANSLNWYIWNWSIGDYYNGLNWNPTHTQPPSVSPNQLGLTIFGDRRDHLLSVQQPDSAGNYVTFCSFIAATGDFYLGSSSYNDGPGGWPWLPFVNDYGATIPVQVGGYAESSLYTTIDGVQTYLHEVFTITTGYDANKPFRIVDETTGEVASVNTSTLAQWYLPPVSKQLPMTSSRWGHALWLTHPTGFSAPLTQHNTAGFFANVGGVAWWVNYYYFDASTLWHDFLPWRIEDRSVSPIARTSLDPDEHELVSEWIYLPTPTDLAAQLQQGAVALTWQATGVSGDGGFVVERRDMTSGVWIALPGVVPASNSAGGTTVFTSVDSTVLSAHDYAYRIRYTFGNLLSSPSLPASAAIGNDIDGDGIPDNIDDDMDGDGQPNAAELVMGTDPKKKDNPILFLSAFGFTHP
jgi:hypothetical protein